MAQQARPHWYTHIEYDRPRLSSLVIGPGRRSRSTRPTATALHANPGPPAQEGPSHRAQTARRPRSRDVVDDERPADDTERRAAFEATPTCDFTLRSLRPPEGPARGESFVSS